MESTWLSISIFCDTDNNYLVLDKGILPKIKQLTGDDILKNWYFKFNNTGGPNIKVPMLVQNTNLNNTVEGIAAYFKSCFYTNVECTSKPLVIDDLYGLFPTNSIQFGLYEVANLYDNSNIKLKQAISELYIEALCKEPVDEETLLSFSLYLHLVAFKETAVFKGVGQIRAFLLDIAKPSNTDAAIQKELINLLQAILADINSNTRYSDELSWLNKWAKVCESDYFLNDPVEVFKLINQHLQLSEKVLNFLIYLLRYHLNNNS